MSWIELFNLFKLFDLDQIKFKFEFWLKLIGAELFELIDAEVFELIGAEFESSFISVVIAYVRYLDFFFYQTQTYLSLNPTESGWLYNHFQRIKKNKLSWTGECCKKFGQLLRTDDSCYKK